MTENAVDVSVNAILRAAKDVKMEVLICDPDYVCLLDWRGSALEVRRSESRIWYWAWLNRLRGGYHAFQRTSGEYVSRNPGVRVDRLDEFASRDVRGYSTAALAIRSVASSNIWRQQRVWMTASGRELPPIPKHDERTAKAVSAYRLAA